MSVPSGVRHRDPYAAVVVVGSFGLLLLRVRLATAPDPTRSLLLALVLGAVLGASLLLPTPAGGSRRFAAVTAAGIGGLALASLVTGPRPPVPWAATALPLSLLAAVAEEALFRRSLYDRLIARGPVIAVVVSAVAFAALHVPAYGWAVFPVDLGAGLLFGWQRHAAGTWTAPALTHATANLMAVLR